jgi:hypothetical protein
VEMPSCRAFKVMILTGSPWLYLSSTTLHSSRWAQAKGS